VKYDKKSQNGLEKETSRKHPHKIYENKDNACLESLIFVSTLVRNRSFHFSRFVQISSKIAPRGSRNGGQQVFLSPKTWQERGLKNIQKTITWKVRKMWKRLPKRTSRKVIFLLFFWGLGPKAILGGPKDPYKHAPMSNLIENGTKMVRIILCLWCFYRSCPRLGGKT